MGNTMTDLTVEDLFDYTNDRLWPQYLPHLFAAIAITFIFYIIV